MYRRARATIPWTILVLVILFGIVKDVTDEYRLQQRAVWMLQLTETVKLSGQRRWNQEDAARAWREFTEDNPGLNFPDSFWPIAKRPENITLPEIPH